MAYSTQRAVSDGTLVYLDLAIGYQSRNDIKVFINDLPAPEGSWAWVGTTDKRISFSPAIPDGSEVLVQRSTRLDRIINVFAGGAKFTNVTMDMNFEQVLFLTQEAVEGSALSDIFNDVDFHNFKIKNLGTATDANDAITFGQVQTMSNGAYAAQIAAEAARTLAQAWAMHTPTTVDGVSYSAKQYSLNSAASATAALASQNAAATSATNSANSATASQTSRLASEAARDATFTARDEAVGAAAPATEIYNRLDDVETLATTANNTANSASTVANAAMPKAGGTFTGTVNGITKAMVGLGNVDNTSDAAKPVSTATQTALNGKVNQYYSSVISIGWTGGAAQLKVDATDFGGTWPINITGQAGTAANANSLGGIAASGWLRSDNSIVSGFASGNEALPYIRHSDNSVRQLVRNRGDVSGMQRDGVNINFYSDGLGFIGGVATTGSDLRMKKDVSPSKRDALKAVRKMRFIQFRYNERGRGADTKVLHKLGFSAQNLRSIDRTYVNKGPDGLYTPDPSWLLALALKAVQELEQRVADLEARIK